MTIIERTDPNPDKDIAAISNIINHNEIGMVIVGLPISLNGSIGEQAEKVKSFTTVLSESIQVPFDYRDERLSTVSARRMMQASNTKKSRRRNQKDDAVAAAIILQSYLDEDH